MPEAAWLLLTIADVWPNVHRAGRALRARHPRLEVQADGNGRRCRRWKEQVARPPRHERPRARLGQRVVGSRGKGRCRDCGMKSSCTGMYVNAFKSFWYTFRCVSDTRCATPAVPRRGRPEIDMIPIATGFMAAHCVDLQHTVT